MNTEKEEVSDSKPKFRWRLNIDEIQPFYLSKAQRPKYKIVQIGHEKKPVPQNMYFSFHDTSDNKMVAAIYEWVEECGNPKYAELELLDKDDNITERWALKNLKLIEADFGLLDYEDTNRCTIDIKVSCGEATLDFLKMENKTFSRKTA